MSTQDKSSTTRLINHRERVMKALPPSRTAPQFVVRFPDEACRDGIAAAAKANGRSMNAEIVHRLGDAEFPKAIKTTTAPTGNVAPFGLRMLPEVRDEIERAAKASGRSMNAEIVARLTDSGMPTMRDYFAANALDGLCANPGGPFQANGMSGWGIVNCTGDDIARTAYDMADAMLKARSA